MLQIEEYLQIMTRTIYFLPKDKEGTDKSVIWNHHNPYPNNLGRATRTPAIATNLHEHGKWKGQREIEDVVPPYEDIDGAARVWSGTPSKGKGERERGGENGGERQPRLDGGGGGGEGGRRPPPHSSRIRRCRCRPSVRRDRERPMGREEEARRRIWNEKREPGIYLVVGVLTRSCRS